MPSLSLLAVPRTVRPRHKQPTQVSQFAKVNPRWLLCWVAAHTGRAQGPHAQCKPLQQSHAPSTHSPSLLPLVLGVTLRRCSAALKPLLADAHEPSAGAGAFSADIKANASDLGWGPSAWRPWLLCGADQAEARFRIALE